MCVYVYACVCGQESEARSGVGNQIWARKITLAHSIREIPLSGTGDLGRWRGVDHQGQEHSSLNPTGLCLSLHSGTDCVTTVKLVNLTVVSVSWSVISILQDC